MFWCLLLISFYNCTFSAVFSSVLLDSGASHNFIAAPQITKFSNSIQHSFLCPDKYIKVHLTDNSQVFFSSNCGFTSNLLIVLYIIFNLRLVLH